MLKLITYTKRKMIDRKLGKIEKLIIKGQTTKLEEFAYLLNERSKLNVK